MKMSERGKQFLAEWEGSECEVYRDVAGLPTIGVGHLLTKDELTSGKIFIQSKQVKYTNGLTEQQVMGLLAQDLKGFEKVVNENVKVQLTQPQFDTLVAFVFNVGGNAFKHSTLLRLLNRGKYEDVPGQLRRWVYSGGQRVRGLVNRREKEIALWNEAGQPVKRGRELVQFGQRAMQRGLKGPDIEELQIRLAGFSPTSSSNSSWASSHLR